MIRAEGLVLGYRNRTVFDGESFAIEGRLVGLLGPNGAGKTTLLNAVATSSSARSGRLEVLGWDVRTKQGVAEVRRRSGYLPQTFGFHPRFTVAEFVQYAGWLKGMTGSVLRNAAAEALDQVDLATESSTRLGQLSGGMLRRAGVAATVVNRPELVILDEPTAGLDPEQRVRFRELIVALSQSCQVLLSTHLVDDVALVADNLVFIGNGAVVFQGSPAQVAALAAGGATGSHTAVERGYVAVMAGVASR